MKKKRTVSEKLGGPVFSIGNLVMGGSGKTPHVIYLAEMIHSTLGSRKAINILSRGYGGNKSAQGMVVRENSDALECGDEPLLVKNRLPYVEVIVGKNRMGSLQRFFPDRVVSRESIFILDDGFQHWQIARDYNIVLIDSFAGLGNGFTIPLGYLREPLTALKGADAVIFTKMEKGSHDRVAWIVEKIKKIKPSLPVFYSRYVANGLLNRDGEIMHLHEMKDKKILLFSGIARHDYFKNLVEEHEPAMTEIMKFRDHVPYDQMMLDMILKKKGQFDLVICTEKDFVKLKGLQGIENIRYLQVSVVMENEAGFAEEVKKVLKRHAQNN